MSTSNEKKMVFIIEDAVDFARNLDAELQDRGCATRIFRGRSADAIADELIEAAKGAAASCCDGITLDLIFPHDQQEWHRNGGKAIWEKIEEQGLDSKFGRILVLTNSIDNEAIQFFEERNADICQEKWNGEIRLKKLDRFVKKL